MMKKQLQKNYSVVAIEVNKRDFVYFNDKDLISTTNNEVGNVVVQYNDKDVVIIDINDSVGAESLCNEVLYLLEPSIIKLNKLMLVDRNALAKYKDKKIVLNQSLLSSKDVLDFEYESKSKIYYNMPPLDDREKNIHALNMMLVKMGFEAQNDGEMAKKNRILGLFQK